MNKTELIEKIAKATGQCKKKTKETLVQAIQVITENLVCGDKVTITGFGTFTVLHRAARKGRNPATGDCLKIRAKSVAKFKAGATLKRAVMNTKVKPKKKKMRCKKEVKKKPCK